MTDPVRVAVALEGHGWHPEAWRLGGDAGPVTAARHWTALAATAERGLLDFVTIDDGPNPQRRRRPEIDPRWLAGRPDALLVAALLATATDHVGIVPVATVGEPCTLSKAVATLDFLTDGRAGWQPRVNPRAARDGVDLFAEATDVVRVVRALWDSWEDGAIVGDATTGRYVDPDRVHPVDGVGAAGVPRPPQGHPVIAALAHARPIYEFAARAADLVFITPTDDDALAAILGEIDEVGGSGLQVWADVYVAFSGAVDPRTEAFVADGAPAELVELILRWQDLGVDGVRLRPAVNSVDLPAIVDDVVPLLQQDGRFRTAYRDGETLRSRLGLSALETQAKVT